MKIKLKDIVNNRLTDAIILPATFKDMPLKKNGWNFNWRQLFKTGGIFYKVILEEKPDEIQGLLKMSFVDNMMLFMDDIEVSPDNFGSNGKYDYVAGVLIAYACKLSFEYGKGAYKGFVVFDSKTRLINLYKNKYGATSAFGQRMFILPEAGKILIKKYLNE